MPLPFKIEYLLGSGRVESERLEFKAGWNPLKVRKELDLTEGRGTGIPKIMGAIRKNRSPEPKFETNRERSFFTVTFPIHPKAQTTRATLDSTPHVGTKSALSQHQVKVLHKCSAESTLLELMKVADRSDRTKFRDQVLRPLLSANLVGMTVPDKPNSRLQKYRLTEKGIAFLNGHSRKA